MGDGLFDLAAGPQLGPQGTQFLCDGLYLAVHVKPPPFLTVQAVPLFGEGVDLRLQGVKEHGKLGGVVDVVGLQKVELGGIAFQPGHFLPHPEGDRRPFPGRLADALQVQLVDIQGA